MAKPKPASPGPVPAVGDRPALLVVDVQQALFERGTPVFRAEHMLANIGLLVQRARSTGTPVIYIRHCNDSFLREGSDGWQLHRALGPLAGEPLIQKQHGNAFQGTSLGSELAGCHAGTVVVTGLVSHGCVKATCLGARELGYQVVLASDAHSNFSKQAASMIEAWNREAVEAGIRVVPSGEIDFTVAR